MAYQVHRVFETPADDTKIWRYMDLPRFVSMLQRQAIFFSRADRLGDPYEGSLTQPTLAALGAQADALLGRLSAELGTPMDREATPRLVREQIETMRQAPSRILVSCWYAAEEESPAMWGHYAHGRYGIAVQSTTGDIRQHLDTGRSVFVGRVKYVDYRTELVPADNVFWPFLHKRAAFAHEQEVRAIIDSSLPYSGEPPNRTRVIPEFEVGLEVHIPLDRLLHRIFVAPQAPLWFREAVEGCVHQFAIDREVQQSEFGQLPSWDVNQGESPCLPSEAL